MDQPWSIYPPSRPARLSDLRQVEVRAQRELSLDEEDTQLGLEPQGRNHLRAQLHMGCLLQR